MEEVVVVAPVETGTVDCVDGASAAAAGLGWYGRVYCHEYGYGRVQTGSYGCAGAGGQRKPPELLCFVSVEGLTGLK